MNKSINRCTLSIITVTYNAEVELEKTIISILSQKQIEQLKLEYIVQDGKSIDSTLTIAQKYEEDFRSRGIAFNIYSEKDNGIYDGMNKAIKKSKGKWICLLNAGDVFSNESSLSDIRNYLEYSKSDILYADYKRINSYIERIVYIPKIEELRNTMIFCHQAILVRDYVYMRYTYDCKYKLVADYDLMLRLYLSNARFEHMSVCLVDYDIDGVSGKNMLETYREIHRVRKNNLRIDYNINDNLKYVLGLGKRVVLANMPQKLRWFVFKILKGE